MGRSAESIHLFAIERTHRIDVQPAVGPEGGVPGTDPQRPRSFAGGDAQPFGHPVQPIGTRVARSIGSVIGAAFESASAVRSVSKIVIVPSRAAGNEVFPNANSVGALEPPEDRFTGKGVAELPS